ERLALAVEQNRGAAEVDAAAERLGELVSNDAFAAQDAEHVGLQQLEKLRVGIAVEKSLQLIGAAFFVLTHCGSPLFHGAPARFAMRSPPSRRRASGWR